MPDNIKAENQATTPSQTVSTDNQAPATNPSATNTSVDSAKKFTQEDIDRVVQERLARDRESFLKKSGVSSFEELDKKLKDGDSARVELVLTQNNIAEDRHNDVKIYFKGLGQNITSEVLTEIVKTHPEWLKKSASQVPTSQPQVQKLGQSQAPAQEKSEIDALNKAFGTHIGENRKPRL